MKRLVDFAIKNEVSISLIYYPPYHSKYNPIERVWAVLENHWRGQILDSVEKTLGLAKTMKWNGNNPVVKLINGTKGVASGTRGVAFTLLTKKWNQRGRVYTLDKKILDTDFHSTISRTYPG